MNFLKRHIRFAQFRQVKVWAGDFVAGPTHHSVGVQVAGHELMVPVSRAVFEWVMDQVHPKA